MIDVIKTNQNITISPEPPEFLYYEENLTYKINAFSDSFLNLDYRIISGTNAILNGDTLEISDIGEFELIKKITQHFTIRQNKTVLGIGDDS